MDSHKDASQHHRRAQDRSMLNSLMEVFVALHGSPRRFERGFSGDWDYLQRTMAELGYELKYYRGVYRFKKHGAPGPAKKIGRIQVLEKIDEVLVANGREPFLRRGE